MSTGRTSSTRSPIGPTPRYQCRGEDGGQTFSFATSLLATFEDRLEHVARAIEVADLSPNEAGLVRGSLVVVFEDGGCNCDW